MKKLLFVLMALPFFAFKCNKSSNNDDDGYLRGKVIRISCASYVVQVLNDDTIGDDGWKDVTKNNTVYDNVFSATNVCKISHDITVGNVIRFKINQPVYNGCMFCAMYDAPPTAKYDINEVTLEGK